MKALSEQPTMKSVQTDLAGHPATRAWLSLRPTLSLPGRIAILGRERRGSVVYRLEGAGPRGGAVIAKRCTGSTAAVEVAIYETILPHIPVSTPHYFGSLVDPDNVIRWLFTEDAGDVWYSTADTEHRNLAAQWLGKLHTSAAQLAADASLPDRGPGHYLGVLQSARDRILNSLGNPALRTDDIDLLEAIVGQCNLLESCWSEVEGFCEEMPKTLIHGDFVGKNVRVRKGTAGSTLLPFDWETAGYGTPAPDLESLDTAVYHSTTSQFWPSVRLEDVQHLAKFGRIFWLINFVFWASANLAYPWVEETMTKQMIYYNSWLTESIGRLGWEK